MAHPCVQILTQKNWREVRELFFPPPKMSIKTTDASIYTAHAYAAELA